MKRIVERTALIAVGGLGLALLGGCEIGPKQTTQTGYRGTGGDQIVDVKHMVKTAPIPPEPYPLPPDGGPKAGESYQNVKVLSGVSTERFNHLMAEISQWVAPPEQGCAYCHNPENMASDEKYTKVVARRMIQMTQTINSTWSPHVQKVGVTCYTCHRGNGVPQYKWALPPGAPHPGSILGDRHYQNETSPDAAYSDLPANGFADYLLGAQSIRVNTTQALPKYDHKGASVMTAEKSYGLMMHMSKALGVNCTYCHNAQAFAAWNLSRPQRVTAWYGIRMVRDVNNTYISSLQAVFPDHHERKGPLGDPYKVNCMTCHQGQNLPLGGVSLMAQAPALWGPVAPYTKGTMAPAAAPAAAAPGPVALNVVPATTAKP
jgi:photosynthetic reaction center cytochrome c subunit